MKKMLLIFAKSRNVVITSMLLSVMMFSLPSLSGQTTVSDTVYGSWTLAESPYLVDSTIVIPNDSTLTIEPGVVVEFQGHYKFNVQGRLLAQGTPESLITFTCSEAARDTGWWGIRFDRTPVTNDTSKIEYAIIEYGHANDFSRGENNNYDDRGGAVLVYNFHKVKITNSKIRYNRAEGSGGGLRFEDSYGLVENCLIHDNVSKTNGGGINIRDRGAPDVINCVIVNNKGRSGGGIQFSYRFVAGMDTALIYGNIIANNESTERGGGVMFGSDNIGYFTNNTVVNNKSPFGGGLAMGERNTGSILTNNIIAGNIATGAGNQIYLMGEQGSYGSHRFYNNLIEGGLQDIKPFYGVGNFIWDNTLDASPDFADPSNSAGINDNALDADWSLLETSIAINTGLNEIRDTVKYDNTGNSRIFDNIIDLGAIEFRAAPTNRLPVLVSKYNTGTLASGEVKKFIVKYIEPDLNDDNIIEISTDNDGVNIQNVTGDTTNSTFEIVGNATSKQSTTITVTVKDPSGETSALNSASFNIKTGSVIRLCDTITNDLVIDSDIVQVNCDVLIDTLVKVTVLPGTLIEFQGYYTLNVKGTLIAEGTADMPITFSAANADTGYRAIRFENTPDYNQASSFKHCIFEYGKAWGIAADDLNGGAMLVDNYMGVSISDCIFRSNYSGNNGGAIYITNGAELSLENILFESNTAMLRGGSVSVDNSSHADVFSCTFKENFAAESGGGIDYYDYSTGSIENSTFTLNSTHKNGAGAAINNYADATVHESFFDKNTSRNHGAHVGVFDYAAGIIEGNTFTNGIAHGGGSVFINDHSTGEVTDNLITSGFARAQGGGIFINRYSSDVLIKGNEIYNNESLKNGGGISFNNNATGRIENNHVYNNVSEQGGGMALRDKSVVLLTQNVTENNEAINDGGGIKISSNAKIDLVGEKVMENMAGNEGGGINVCGYNSSGTVLKVYNSVIAKNSSVVSGGAINVFDDASAYVYNSHIVENSSNTGGALSVGFYVDSLLLKNSVIYGNTAPNAPQVFSKDQYFIGFLNNLFEAGVAVSIETFYALPSFVDEGNIAGIPVYSGSITEPYFPDPTSPVIDAGHADVSDVMFSPFDLAGNKRVQGSIDIGAYESSNFAPFFVDDVMHLHINENSPAGTSAGIALADDLNGNTLKYSLFNESASGVFDVDDATGNITVADASALNFESNPVFTSSVKAEEQGTVDLYKAVGNVIIHLIDVNETPIFNTEKVEVFTDRWAANGESISTANPAYDEDGDAITYSMANPSTQGIFDVNPATGEILIADASMLSGEVATVTFTLVASDGELSAEVPAIVHIVATNTQQLMSLHNIKLFPNPAMDVVNIECNGVQKMDVSVISPEGRIIFNKNFNTSVAELNVQNFDSGIYLVKIQTENGTVIKRLTKR